MADTSLLDQITGKYAAAGRPTDIQGLKYWTDAIGSGSKSIDDLGWGLGNEDKNSASTKGIISAGNILGLKPGDVLDPSQLGADDKTNLITSAYDMGGLHRPDQATFGNLFKNFNTDFSDYNLDDDFNSIFADPAQRSHVLDAVYQQGLYDTAHMGSGGRGGGSSGGSGGMDLSSLLGGYGSGQPVDAYLSPFLNQVLDPAIRDLTTATSKARNDLGSQAFMSGAYGDARHGVESGVLTDNFLKNVGDISGQLRNAGYSESMGWLGQDLDRQLSAGNANIAADQNQVGSALSAIGTGATIDQNATANQMSLADLLTGYDQYTRNQALNEAQYPGNQMIALINALNGIGGNSSNVSSSSSPNNSIYQILGAYLGSRK